MLSFQRRQRRKQCQLMHSMVQRDVFSLVDWSERLQTSDSLVVAMLTLALEYVPLRTVQRGERLRAMLPAQIQRAMCSQVVL